jgi:hypothetical protein
MKVNNCKECPLFAGCENYTWCQHPDGPGTGVDHGETESKVHASCPLLKKSLHISLEYNVKTFDGHDVRPSKAYIKWLEKHPEMAHLEK